MLFFLVLPVARYHANHAYSLSNQNAHISRVPVAVKSIFLYLKCTALLAIRAISAGGYSSVAVLCPKSVRGPRRNAHASSALPCSLLLRRYVESLQAKR